MTLNEKYLPPLQVLLTSLRTAHPDEALTVWLLHSGIRPAALEMVERQCGRLGMTLRCLTVDRSVFDAAPVTRQYPQEMYYRLLAGCFLPKELDRVLYIDPDILVLNSLRPLWETPLEGRLFAAASHTGKTGLMNNINQVRLGTDCKYFNSGVPVSYTHLHHQAAAGALYLRQQLLQRPLPGHPRGRLHRHGGEGAGRR